MASEPAVAAVSERATASEAIYKLFYTADSASRELLSWKLLCLDNLAMASPASERLEELFAGLTEGAPYAPLAAVKEKEHRRVETESC